MLKKGRLLILRRFPSRRFLPNRWDVPGGHVEEGESDAPALRREAREETGLIVRVGRPLRTVRYDILHEGTAEEVDPVGTVGTRDVCGSTGARTSPTVGSRP